MDKGDIVRFKSNRLRKTFGPEMGVLIKRTYLAYDSYFTKWDVLFSDGTVKNIRESHLSKIDKDQGMHI